MFSDYLRRVSLPLLNVIARVFSRLGISPNMLTITGFVLNLAVAAVLGSGNLRLGGLLILLASIVDSFDGALARYTKRTSKFGAFLDSTLDRYSEAALFTGLLWYFSGIGARQECILACVALFGSLAVSYTRARAEGLGIECKVGFFSRVERMIVLSVGLMINLPLATLWILAVFSHITAVQRILHVRHNTLAASNK